MNMSRITAFSVAAWVIIPALVAAVYAAPAGNTALKLPGTGQLTNHAATADQSTPSDTGWSGSTPDAQPTTGDTGWS